MQFNNPSSRKIKNMATSQLRNSILLVHFSGCGLLFASLLLTCLALPQKTQAVVPAPNGGYPGFNHGRRYHALKSLTTGVGNAAIGWYSLFKQHGRKLQHCCRCGTLLFNTGDQSSGHGTQNTAVVRRRFYLIPPALNNIAVGSQALFSNTYNSFNTALGAQALLNNTATSNTAVGYAALRRQHARLLEHGNRR